MARWLKELFLSLFGSRPGGTTTSGLGADCPDEIPQTQGVGEVGESLLNFSEVLLFGREITELEYKSGKGAGCGRNRFLEEQVEPGPEDGTADDPRFARIYGFSYDGAYYELPSPALFLMQCAGRLVNGFKGIEGDAPGKLAARAPNQPGLTGIAAADFQFADDICVWSVQQSDYTIRMDVMNGRYEQVLLDMFFGTEMPGVTGAKVSGAKVSGAKVSGAKVSGAKVSGAKVSGAKARGGD
ncbi:hypothetical protein Q5Y75_08105 [Ruegeria sp. 2205SS24-7]|uniref:hypothetical protein n=1 Tax=Ruegeria discodermiae TaxID=3064389 RepID=UPI0027417C7D|nr:hypothetical protein [Ruegeria sp. 2205SS24-7]MDP5217177.1 hypothetical protein [Ruegeria sp. 2205SS24-7]